MLVGPQASGKSVLLQTLKAVVDVDPIVEALKLHGYSFKSDASFLELVHGEGMGAMYGESTLITADGQPWVPYTAAQAALSKHGRAEARLFYIPAQRVLTLRDGWPTPFTSFEIEAPFVVKQFSEDVRRLLEERETVEPIFPTPARWKSEIRGMVDAAVFHGARLRVDDTRLRKRIVLDVGKGPLPFLSWSAGQREFVPLMLGLYWLMPAQATPRRRQLEYAVIEEPEMGLHPAAITAVAAVVLDLMKRGYRVILSTHSPHLLQLVWALRTVQGSLQDRPELLSRLFGQPQSAGMNEIARSIGRKELRVLYLGAAPGGVIGKDISSLDAGSEDPDVRNWGGLTDFAERAEELVRDGLLPFP